MSTSQERRPPIAPESNMPGLLVTGICGALLLLHLVLRFYYGTMKDGLDAIGLGLAVAGLSPWIATAVKSLKFGGMEVQFQEIKTEVARQGDEIEQLQFLIRNFVAKWELQHLQGLASGEAYRVNTPGSPSFEAEIRNLRARGFIDHGRIKTSIRDFIHQNAGEKDMSEFFEITEVGKRYLAYWQQAGR